MWLPLYVEDHSWQTWNDHLKVRSKPEFRPSSSVLSDCVHTKGRGSTLGTSHQSASKLSATVGIGDAVWSAMLSVQLSATLSAMHAVRDREIAPLSFRKKLSRISTKTFAEC